MNTENIWNDYSSEIFNYFRSKTGDGNTAEDLRQDVFLKIHENIGKIQSEQKMEHWLRVVAHNTLMDHFKSEKRYFDISDAGFNDDIDLNLKLAIHRCLSNMIEQLPEKYAKPLIKSDLEGIPQKQIADELGISISGAKSRIQRARIMLKENIDTCCKVELNTRSEIVGSQCETESCDCEE